jgi:hypothetical protein
MFIFLVFEQVIPFARGNAWEQPPPDLASYLYKNRIIYLGMSLVPSVTELMVAEFLYLQYDDATKPIYLYVNSTGTTKVSGVFRLNMCCLVYLSYCANSRNCLMKNVRGTNELFFLGGAGCRKLGVGKCVHQRRGTKVNVTVQIFHFVK